MVKSFFPMLFLSIQVLAQNVNIAYQAHAEQSSTTNNGVASRAVDGNTDGQWSAGSTTHTANEAEPFWQCDWGYSADVQEIRIWNRTDCCMERLHDFYVFLSETPFETEDPQVLANDANVWNYIYQGFAFESLAIDAQYNARYLRIQVLNGSNPMPLSLAEVEVMSPDNGKQTQYVTFEPITKMRTDDPPFTPVATSTSQLTVQFEIVDGPAEVVDGEIILSGQPGQVTVRAMQPGNGAFNPSAPRYQSFDVIDPATVIPSTAIVSLNESFDLEMPELKPFRITAQAAIGHPELFDIQNVDFLVDGVAYTTFHHRGLYHTWWLPPQYGTYIIEVTATGTNGVSNVATTEITVTPTTENRQITTFDKDLISFPNASRTIMKSFDLPTFVGGYSRILAFLDITCPDSGCDPWDRVAWIQVRHPGSEWIEIIRYITPYGRGCNHNIDLTEYRDILQGKIEMRFFIDTWAEGWEVTLNLLYEAGTPEYLYSEVDVLWDGRYDFGNPDNLQSVDTVTYNFPNQVEKAEIRILISGHGWGQNNSENAAEFRETVNTMKVNDDNFQHVVWDICNPNPDGCQPQNGTWQFSRSGWCPGAITKPFVFDMTPFIPQSDNTFIYQLDQSYIDYCHPNSFTCVSGVTCPNCNDGFNPHYYIRGNLVTYSNSPIDIGGTSATVEKDYSSPMRIIPNPANDQTLVTWDDNSAHSMEVYATDGKMMARIPLEKHTRQKTLMTTTWQPGIYFIRLISDNHSLTSGSFVKL